MKKALKIFAVIIVALPILMLGWLFYSTDKNLASPTTEALAALVRDDAVVVDNGDWLVMRPSVSTPTAGLILYPGANCDIRGYAPLMREFAAAGYLAIVVSMPFDFSIFAPDRADDVIAAFPEIQDWVIAGHSMGGAMAGRYAFHHSDDLAGLILWDSYPPGANSLADSDLPVLHVHRATTDGLPPQKFADMRSVFPSDSVWVPVPGGIHMYFGSFDGGGYVDEWTPQIPRSEQHATVIAATLDGLARMTD
jgi:pimeloyl-ACP methyl ester carboxylesterase